MSINSVEERSRLDLIAKFASYRIPSVFEHIFKRLHFSAFEKNLARAVLRIECTARPSEIRGMEFLFGLLAAGKSWAANSVPKNYTVGPFQIGVTTSLKWTRTPLNFWQYGRRLAYLATREGS